MSYERRIKAAAAAAARAEVERTRRNWLMVGAAILRYGHQPTHRDQIILAGAEHEYVAAFREAKAVCGDNL